MKNNTKLPEIILDITDETKTIDEQIAECEAARKAALTWRKRIIKRIKNWF